MTDGLLVRGEQAGVCGAEATGIGWPDVVRVNPALTMLAKARRVLLLQGPVGPFFDRLAAWLTGRGASVQRVAFQGGDAHDCRLLDPIRFTAGAESWSAFFASLIEDRKPDCVVLFGQSRRYHKVALERARAVDLPVVVMEEGYFRPGFVTMELGGVNGYSKTLDQFEWAGVDPRLGLPTIHPDLCELHFQKMAWHASQHYIAMHKGRAAFPAYQHHRVSDPAFYARYWLRSWARKAWHRGADRRDQRRLFDSQRPYYFVPLQLDGDSQIVYHSPFGTNVDFVHHVVASFARHAPADTLLVFRQHPHSRGGTSLRDLIASLANSLGVGRRVLHLVEGDTPDLAQHSLGTVVINSTVGLQALERGSPLIALGDSLYKRPGLTFQGSLDKFWWERARPDRRAAQTFLAKVKNLTQAPVSVYDWRDRPLAWSGLC